jgi:hypothetical protein
MVVKGSPVFIEFAMDKLKPIIGSGSIVPVTEQITAVAGVGAVEQVQPRNGTGTLARTTGCGNINGRK